MIPEVPEDARLEIKFVGFDSLRSHILHWIRMNPAGFRTAYPDRRVSSIYFECEGYESYRDTLEGSRSRVKVRYRWYGEAVKPAASSTQPSPWCSLRSEWEVPPFGVFPVPSFC